MRPLRCVYLLVVVCMICLVSAWGQKEDWLPITQKDLDIKEIPGNPGASAIQLYYAQYINDNDGTTFYYHRIKILTEKGRQPGSDGYADVEIPILSGFSISGLKARTIHPDGKITDFSGKPFEKTLIKGKGIKILAKAFTMPEVTVGSIIEYKYKINTPDGVVYNSSWDIQHNLFTVQENLVFKAYEGRLRTEDGTSQLSYTTVHLDKKPVLKGTTVTLDLENVPGFASESFMPPEAIYKPQVNFFYGGSELSSADKFWQKNGERWTESAEHFIGNHREIRETAAQVIGAETDPGQKLRKLYARAQQIRNLAYERDRTEQELKKENLKNNENVVDVLQRGYGNRQEITFFFVALARAAGFDASVLRVSSRSERFFDKNLPDSRQLDSDLAAVFIEGRDLYLDPATKFCPYGLVRWNRTSTAALKLGKSGTTFLNIPPARQDKAVTVRTAKVSVDEDGTLTGTLDVSFQGGEALEHRLDALGTDEAGKKKNLEDEVRSWLPTGSVVTMTGAQGWDATDDPLTVHLTIQVPSFASFAGKRLLMPSYLLQSKQKDAFKNAERKYPVYFAYAFAELDNVSIQIPSGYSLEGTSAQQNANLPYARYQLFSKVEGTRLVTQRALLLNGVYFDPTKYKELKDFFSKVQAGDEQQAVLRAGGNVNDKKGE